MDEQPSKDPSLLPTLKAEIVHSFHDPFNSEFAIPTSVIIHKRTGSIQLGYLRALTHPSNKQIVRWHIIGLHLQLLQFDSFIHHGHSSPGMMVRSRGKTVLGSIITSLSSSVEDKDEDTPGRIHLANKFRAVEANWCKLKLGLGFDQIQLGIN